MNSFAFDLGRAAAKRRNIEKREQTEPMLGGDFLDDWRRGYGGNGLPSKRSEPTAAAVSAPVTTATKLPKQASLFDPGEPAAKPNPAKAAEPKPPTPVPVDEIQDEINLLVNIGIGLSEADELVRKKQWTLDQMVCQWKLGNEAGLPQHVIGRVARYGQQRWGESIGGAAT